VVKECTHGENERRLGPQEVINHGFFTTEEIWIITLGFYGRRLSEERRKFLLQRLSLWEHRHKKVRELSGGMKRRLMIAKALVHEQNFCCWMSQPLALTLICD